MWRLRSAANRMQATDAVIAQIAEYAVDYEPESELALDTARLCLMD